MRRNVRWLEDLHKRIRAKGASHGVDFDERYVWD
jgi:hypothetical protein